VAPPPAIFATVEEGSVLPLQFDVTNPATNGTTFINFIAVANVPGGPDTTDSITGMDQGGSCVTGKVLASLGACTITLLLKTDDDGIEPNPDNGTSTITVSVQPSFLGTGGAGRTDTSILVQVVDKVPEPSTLALFGIGTLGVFGSRTWRRFWTS
jgi:hypothetical protein